ncbi:MULTISPECIES: hypothetical protein [Halorussus]|uniref:hypothetical protein n=1 Tax=Halorussus TaxID=1070314 RepID=UPI0020A223A1|nr:hypothetical protein [Halorussus vallis]USZ75861.1 hypothetical protein NGM07_00730 [Halorussus vallis]
MNQVVENLEAVEVDDRLRVALEDGTEFEGRASPVDYDPEDSLRIEVRPQGENDRYELRATYDEGWSDVTVRHVVADAPDAQWEDVGTVRSVEIRGSGGEIQGETAGAEETSQEMDDDHGG